MISDLDISDRLNQIKIAAMIVSLHNSSVISSLCYRALCDYANNNNCDKDINQIIHHVDTFFKIEQEKSNSPVVSAKDVIKDKEQI